MGNALYILLLTDIYDRWLHGILMWISEGKSPLEMSRCIWKLFMCMETSYDILLENTTVDHFEDLILVVNKVLKRLTNINTEVGLEECERYSPGLE